MGGGVSLFVIDFIWEKRRLVGFKASNIMLGQKSSFARRTVEAEVSGKMLKVTEKTFGCRFTRSSFFAKENNQIKTESARVVKCGDDNGRSGQLTRYRVHVRLNRAFLVGIRCLEYFSYKKS